MSYERDELAAIVVSFFRMTENGVAYIDHKGAADAIREAGYTKQVPGSRQ